MKRLLQLVADCITSTLGWRSPSLFWTAWFTIGSHVLLCDLNLIVALMYVLNLMDLSAPTRPWRRRDQISASWLSSSMLGG